MAAWEAGIDFCIHSNMEVMKPITIMGANASGKTGLALEIAKKTGGEIISADSKQIFTKLEAGTAKPAGEWRKTEDGSRLYFVEGIPYHFLDFIDPLVRYDVGTYVRDVKRTMNEIRARGHVPVIAGGTGMYIQSFWNGIDELPPANAEIRAELNLIASEKGRAALHAALEAIDPETAEKIPVNNVQRVIRAIEISRLTGRPASKVWSGRFFNSLPVSEGKFIFLRWSKECLQERVKERTLDHFDAWEKEIRVLLDEGYPQDCPGLRSLGYPEMIDYIHGVRSRHETVQMIVNVSLAYAKRQNTWFNRYHNIKKYEFSKKTDYKVSALAEEIINS